MTATATVSLSASQTEALLQGLTVLTQRLDELSTAPAFTTEMVALSQPMATLQQIGQVLADGLSQPLSELVVGTTKTVAEVKTLIQTAVDAVGDLQISAITESLETLADRQILWLDLALSASSTLVDYSLALGQSPSSDAGVPSLLDQGLKTGDIAIDVEAGVHGNIRIGVDLRPGLAADQAIVFKVDNLEACATADGEVEDVTVSYGILDLGALDAQVELEACVLIDLVEGSLGHLTLGDLNAGSASSLFNLSWPGAGDSTADLSVDFEFELDIDGFAQSGQILTLGIEALDGFDLGTLELVLPEIQIDGAWRAPAAVVRRDGVDQLISWDGFPMPVTANVGTTQFPVIDSPALPAPKLAGGATVDFNTAWQGEDIAASLELLAVLLRQPWGSQIGGIDARDFSSTRAMIVSTTFGTRIYWGGRYNKPALGEVNSEQKIGHLTELYNKHNRIDAGYPMIYVNNTKLQFNISATAEALALRIEAMREEPAKGE